MYVNLDFLNLENLIAIPSIVSFLANHVINIIHICKFQTKFDTEKIWSFAD